MRKPEDAPIKLVGHEKEVMTIAFNQYDPYQFASTGDDDKVLIWHGEPFLDRSNPPDIIGRTQLDSRSTGMPSSYLMFHVSVKQIGFVLN